MKRAAFVIAVALSLACSDSSGPKIADVSGAWSYNVTGLAGGGLSCNIGGVTVTLSQTGATFTGSFGSGVLSCGSAGTFNFTGGTVASGTVSGNAVSFNFGTQDWVHNGTLSGNTIAGSTTVRLVPSSGQVVVLLGSFSMVR